MKFFLLFNFALAICIQLFSFSIVALSDRFCEATPSVLFRLDDAGAYGTEALSMEVIDAFIDSRLPILVGLIPFPQENILKVEPGSIRLEDYYSETFLKYLSKHDEEIIIAMHGVNHSVKERGLNQLSYPDPYIRNATEQFSKHFDTFNTRKKYIAPWNHASIDALKTAERFGFAEYHTSTKNHNAVTLNDMQIIPSSMSLRHFLRKGVNKCFDKEVIVQFHPYDFVLNDKRSYIGVDELRAKLQAANVKPMTSEELIFEQVDRGGSFNIMELRKYVPSIFWLNYNDVRHSGYVDAVFILSLLNITLCLGFLIATKLPMYSLVFVCIIGLPLVLIAPIKLQLFLTFGFLGFLTSSVRRKIS